VPSRSAKRPFKTAKIQKNYELQTIPAIFLIFYSLETYQISICNDRVCKVLQQELQYNQLVPWLK